MLSRKDEKMQEGQDDEGQFQRGGGEVKRVIRNTKRKAGGLERTSAPPNPKRRWQKTKELGSQDKNCPPLRNTGGKRKRREKAPKRDLHSY